MQESNHVFPANGGSMAFDHTGRFLYMANSMNNTITVYDFDANTGLLTEGASYATGQSPVSIVVAQP
jgi:6-phosphogluconolactonase (cycloisomerase 2 family)